MRKSDREYESIKSLLALTRGTLNEAKEEEKEESIAITNDVRFGQEVLKNQIDAADL